MKTKKLTREEIQEKLNALVELRSRPISVSELKRIGCDPKHYGGSGSDSEPTESEEDEDADASNYDSYEFRNVILKDRINITQAPDLSTVRYAEVECEDCGCMCKNRQVEIKVYPRSPRPHKRTFCKTCQKGKNPWTGEFVLEKDVYMRAWSAWEHESPDPERRHEDTVWSDFKKPKKDTD